MAKYGIAVIANWMRRGLTFGRCPDRGFGGLPELGRDFTDDEVNELSAASAQPR